MNVLAGRRTVRIVAVVVAAIVVLGVLAQLLLPRIAASTVRSKLEKYGTVKSVTVTAWPAMKLMFKHADEVTASTGWLKLDPEQAVSLFEEAKGTQTVKASSEGIEMGGLRLSDTRMQKHGSALRIEGTIDAQEINRALPGGLNVTLMGSEAGKVTVRASGGALGVSASVEAVAEAEDGKLVVHPTAPFLTGLKLTVFEAPGLFIEGVEAHPVAGGGAGAQRYVLSMWASLRG
jgi:hypothetical protein